MNEQIEKQIEKLADAIYTNCPACLLTEEAEMIARFVVEEQGYRKQSVGEWSWIADDSPMCNICGNVFDTNDNADAGLWKFCPNCGVKMKGGAE